MPDPIAPTTRSRSTPAWWQGAVFYQIYPRSFADGNGDGIGDFPGMTARLDYLRDLGVDALWLSPHYPSPFVDCGYDISDYTDVGPEYGTLDDFVTFLREAHAHDIRVVLDLVLNHTSDQHPWFVESRSGRDSPRRDWYVWRDGRGDGPPNNWASIFGGSAWQLDDASGQFYYHAFLPEQPDLNWRNPDVKAAMWKAVRFWLELGVDGFRLDAIATIYEDPALPDHTLPVSADEILDANRLPEPERLRLLAYQREQPGVHDLMKELRALLDTYPGDRVLIGESENLAFHGSGDDEIHLVFNFPLINTPRLTPEHVRGNQAMRLAAIPAGAWPCNTLGNHDSSRVRSRYADGAHDVALAKLHAGLILTLKGTPFLYNGEEIGMTDLVLTSFDQLRDHAAVAEYRRMIGRLGVPAEQALASVVTTTRDRCRTPLQWRNEPNAGFSPPDAATWLPVNPNYADGVNVDDQEDEPGSVLRFYRRLLATRRATPALALGDYVAFDDEADEILSFWRDDPVTGQRCLVALNFSAERRPVAIDVDHSRVRVVFAEPETADALMPPGSVNLEPFGMVIAEVV
ncbi:MAG: alpha-glucosidase [Chloroflexota bacterium]